MRDIFALILISSLFTGAVMLLLSTYDKRLGKRLSPRKRATVGTLTLMLQPAILTLAAIFSRVPTAEVTSEVTASTATLSFAQTAIPETASSVQAEVASASPAFSLPNFGIVFGVLTLLWLAGVAVTALYKMVSYLRFTHTLKKSLSPFDYEARIPVFTSPNASSPFLIGFFRSRIILPERPMDKGELDLAIRHELIHHERHDIQKKFFAEALKCLNWFNTAFYVFANKLSELSELTVDEILSSSLDYNGRKAYGGLLLRFASVGTGSAFCSELSRAASNLATRLEVIMTENRSKITRKEKIILTTLAVCAVAVITLSICICAAAMPESGGGQNGIIEIDESKVIESYGIEQDPVKGFSKLSEIGEKLDEDEIDGITPTWSMYSLSLTSSDDGTLSLSSIAYTNGQVMVLGADDTALSLPAGTEVTIRIIPDFSADYSNTDGNGEHAEVGYILDGKAVELFNGFIQEDGFELTFTAAEAGEYQIYLINCSAGMQNYASVEVELS
ncbi:MAG: M56 family metallopeptidase [Oscillospiraceae bacterium]|nr:M56 family metallopeptidase [Oscillospiraceae bacterium]